MAIQPIYPDINALLLLAMYHTVCGHKCIYLVFIWHMLCVCVTMIIFNLIFSVCMHLFVLRLLQICPAPAA